MWVRETNKIPAGWRPGQPLPASIPKKPAIMMERIYGMGAHPTVVARVANKKAGVYQPQVGRRRKKVLD